MEGPIVLNPSEENQVVRHLAILMGVDTCSNLLYGFWAVFRSQDPNVCQLAYLTTLSSMSLWIAQGSVTLPVYYAVQVAVIRYYFLLFFHVILYQLYWRFRDMDPDLETHCIHISLIVIKCLLHHSVQRLKARVTALTTSPSFLTTSPFDTL